MGSDKIQQIVGALHADIKETIDDLIARHRDVDESTILGLVVEQLVVKVVEDNESKREARQYLDGILDGVVPLEPLRLN